MEKVGRNDPCPCGSGKKYKKCCELKEAPKQTHKPLNARSISVQTASPDRMERVKSLFEKKASEEAKPAEETPKPKDQPPDQG
jgi:hypothetical protein